MISESRIIYEVSGSKISVVTTLKTVFSIAMRIEIFAPGVINAIKSSSGRKSTRAATVPNTLNSTWSIAARRESADVPNEASTASIVEPIPLPRVMAAALSHVTTRLNASVMTTAVKALEE